MKLVNVSSKPLLLPSTNAPIRPAKTLLQPAVRFGDGDKVITSINIVDLVAFAIMIFLGTTGIQSSIKNRPIEDCVVQAVQQQPNAPTLHTAVRECKALYKSIREEMDRQD